MNLNTLRLRAARVSGMALADTADLALIDAWANEAVEQFLRETKINVLTATLAVTADQDDYTLDTDILALQAMWYEPVDAQSALLIPLSAEEMAERRIHPVGSGQDPKYYSIIGAHLLQLYPAPTSSSDLIHVLYVARASSALSTTADDPSAAAYGGIPTEYHTVLEAYVKWKACEAEENKAYQNGLQFQAEWERSLGKIRGEIKRKAGMVLPSARIGRRTGRHFASPGIDLR